jgi:hypothetical protein
VSCAICEARKEKRFCPAVHGRICPQCCGEQREVTLDCPSDCVYLRQAREHEKPHTMGSLDQTALFPALEISEQFLYDHDPLIMGVSFALAKPARQDGSLKDSDLIGALAAMAKTYETLVNSGLLVERSFASAGQQAVVTELQELLKGYRAEEEKHLGYSRLRDSDVFRALVFWLRMGHSLASARPRSRAFIDFLFRQFPEKQSSIIPLEEAGSRIILP